MAGGENPSDSSVQRGLEPTIRAMFAANHSVTVAPARLRLGDGVAVDVDIVDADRTVLGEIYAHAGQLVSGHRKKVANDALKLITVGRQFPKARLYLVLIDSVAEASARTGWLGFALAEWGIRIETVELAPEELSVLRAAQLGQGLAVGGRQRAVDGELSHEA